MKTILGSIGKFYSDWLHPTFDSSVAFFADNQYAIYFLVVFLVILSIARGVITKKAKTQKPIKLIDFITGVIVLLLIIVAYTSFAPPFFKFIKSTPSTNTSTPTKTSPESTPSSESTPSQQSTPSSTPKQLYYGGGCSGCYADACPRDGYSYGGYDVNMYNYYRSLCQQCQCTSSRWQSLWL